MDEVRQDELGKEPGEDIAEEDEGFGRCGGDEIEGGGEENYIEDVVDEACSLLRMGWISDG